MSSPKTIYTYDLNGSNKLFSIPFEYLARKYVTITAIGATRKTLVLNTDYRFISATQIQTTVALGGADGFLTLELRRYTSATERLVTFNDGSILRATDMNLSQLQSIHLAEEARDLTSDTIGTNANGELDARGKKIVNVVNGINNLDAVNYQQLMLAQGSTGQAAASAAASATTATTKATDAANSATGAANSATAAASSASQASSSASTATTKAAEASSSATTATTKAAEATSAANSAANSATAAAASESSASTSKTSALNSRDVAISKAAEASTSASQAASSATGAANSASSAAASATTATNKATDAANSATAAATSATSAANSATTATTKASEASSSASSALASKNAAATSASQAAGYAAGLNMPSAVGNGGKFLAQKSNETGFEYVPSYTQAEVTSLIAEAMAMAVPVGAVMPFASTGIPTGWLLADGRAVSRSTYSSLFAYIGTLYGGGDGSTTFNLPDCRIEFIRGADLGKGVDVTRTVGAKQLDQMQRITGGIHGRIESLTGAFSRVTEASSNQAVGSGIKLIASFDSGNSPNARVSADTNGETRPRNIAMMYCIKH